MFDFVTVKQAGRDFTYLIVVLVGLGVTGEVKIQVKKKKNLP